MVRRIVFLHLRHKFRHVASAYWRIFVFPTLAMPLKQTL
jgi:hypothetical protein